MKNTHTTQANENSHIQHIAIKNLIKSPLNVRKKASGGIGELAALIAAQGLIHNLVVTEQKKKNKNTGKYEVVAGGRRLDALNLLVAQARLSKEYEVDCRVVGTEEALELSLAENSGREAMHPADLVMAYRNLTEAGLSPDEIAPRFGVSPLTVKRYLKLTHVSPAIFKLYANDEMNFEQISALALTDDHALQERIWNSTPEWQRSGSNFRRLITGTEIDIQRSPLVRFVGLDKYEAAGGLVRRDLFGEEDGGYIQDIELLESLALEKLNEHVQSIKEEGCAWVQVHTTFDHSDRAEFASVRTTRRAPTPAEQGRMDTLDAQMETLQAEYEAYDEDADESGERYAALDEKANCIQTAMDALQDSLAVLDPDDAALAGAIVTIDRSGELRIERNLIRKEEMKKRPAGQGGAGGAEGSAENGKGEAAKPVHSEKLTRMLTAHRTAAIQATMASQPNVALAALVCTLAPRNVLGSHGDSLSVEIHPKRVYLTPDAADIEESKAALALAGKCQYWKDRVVAGKQEGKDLFAWLLEQPQQDLLDLLALCVSLSINTVSGRENAPSAAVASMMTALNLDMTQWWEVTAENYLSHVNKERILSIVREQLSPEIAQTMAGLKKVDLVRQAAAALAHSKWLPDNLMVQKSLEE